MISVCTAVMVLLVSREGQAQVLLEEPPAPPVRKKERHIGEGPWSGWKTSGNAEGGLFGIEPTFTRVLMGAQQSNGIGARLRGWAEAFGQSWYPDDGKSFRVQSDWSIGADSTGFIGHFQVGGTLGYRWVVGGTRESQTFKDKPLYKALDSETKKSLNSVFSKSRHSLFARIGFFTSWGGNQALYSSRFELPRIEFGYAHQGDDGWALEARTEVGAILIGRMNPFEAQRKLGGAPVWSIHTALHQRRALHVEFGFTRVEDRWSRVGTVVDEVKLLSCFHTGTRKRFMDEEKRLIKGICAEIEGRRGDVILPDQTIQMASSLFGGIVFSLGWMD